MHTKRQEHGILVQGGDTQTHNMHSDEKLLSRILEVVDAHVMNTGKAKSRVLTYVIDELAKHKRNLDDPTSVS